MRPFINEAVQSDSPMPSESVSAVHHENCEHADFTTWPGCGLLACNLSLYMCSLSCMVSKRQWKLQMLTSCHFLLLLQEAVADALCRLQPGRMPCEITTPFHAALQF